MNMKNIVETKLFEVPCSLRKYARALSRSATSLEKNGLWLSLWAVHKWHHHSEGGDDETGVCQGKMTKQDHLRMNNSTGSNNHLQSIDPFRSMIIKKNNIWDKMTCWQGRAGRGSSCDEVIYEQPVLKQISSLSLMMSFSLRNGDLGNLSERNVALWNPIGSPPASLMMIMLMVM